MKTYLFIFLLIGFSSQAQISGEIEYKIRMVFNPIDSLERVQEDPPVEGFKVFKRKLKESKKLLPQLKYRLKFNENEALFYLEDLMANDQDQSLLEYALILSDSKESYYTTKKDNEFYTYKQSELGGEYFLVHNSPFQWELSGETKEIAGYVCRKATTKYKRNSEVELEVTAWYAPELAFQYGIKDFSGLPGIVLGLEEHGYYFYADKIALTKKDKKIKVPKGKIIKKDEFNLKMETYYNQFYERE